MISSPWSKRQDQTSIFSVLRMNSMIKYQWSTVRSMIKNTIERYLYSTVCNVIKIYNTCTSNDKRSKIKDPWKNLHDQRSIRNSAIKDPWSKICDHRYKIHCHKSKVLYMMKGSLSKIHIHGFKTKYSL